MAPRCGLCLEENVENGHEQTERHLNNVLLDQLEKKSKKLAENRNGIKVSTTVSPIAYHAAPLLADTEQSELKISVKPREGINFKFTIKNDDPRHEIYFRGVETLAASKFGFKLINDNMRFGATNVRIPPGTCLSEEICVSFESSIPSRYKPSIYFIFAHGAGARDEYTVILKQLLVFVEAVKNKHESVDSPYALQPVKADRIEWTTAGKKGQDDVFKLPSDLKKIFKRNLKTDDDYLTAEQKTKAEKIKAIFEAGPVEYNYIEFFHNLLWYEETVIGCNLKNYNMSGVTLTRSVSGKTYTLLVPGLAEKRPSLMKGDLAFVRLHKKTDVMYEAIITEIQDNLAQFGGLSDAFHRQYTSLGKVDIRFRMSRMPLERMHAAVDSVRRQHMHKKTFPKGNEMVPSIKPIKNSRFYNPLVANNPEQRTVVEHIVSGSSGTAPYLLHGPPGTGKTVTIVEAILQLAETATNRILVCTDSNTAADHVATQLIQYADMFPQEKFLLRANSEYRVWESMRNPEILAPYSNGTSRAGWKRVDINKFISHKIVITTLVHAAKFAKDIKQNNRVTHVFIDEAAQASEPASLIPLCGLLQPGGALVLAGDPLQLGPVVISREASKQGLGISLMERLKRDCTLYSDERTDPNFIMMLKKNFRSHQDILCIPDELFYHGQLEALAPVDYISTVAILGEAEQSRAVVFYGVPSQEQRMGKSPSFYNDSELEVVQSHILALLDVHRVVQADIGVVTPYIRQVYKMKQWLQERGLNIEVGTVEGFQGKEKRVIIVSTVRARCELVAHDAKFRLGFLVDAKRFNVALTRAKAKLIVIGNPTCLQRDPKWRRYMSKCRELGTYHGLDLGDEDTQTQNLDRVRQILDLTNSLQREQMVDGFRNMNVQE